MAAGKTTQVVLEGRKLERFKSLFFSKDEHVLMAQEAAGETENWKQRLKHGIALAGRPIVKDPVLQQRLNDLFMSSGLEDAKARGYYESVDPNAAQVNLDVRAKAPFLYSFLFNNDFLISEIRVHCREEGDKTFLTFTQAGRSALTIGSCIVTAILLGACILPGLVFLYFANMIFSTWNKMESIVVQAVHESLIR